MDTLKKNRFIREFENKVEDTIKKYHLFTKKDKVLVACSGGKDSTAVLHILKKRGYIVQAITIDALIGNYTQKNLENLKQFCKENGVKLHIISFRDAFGKSLCYIRQTLASKGTKLRSCTICGILRRYLINKAAKRLNADYLVTGHNLDDEAQSVMMNLLRNQLEVGSRLGPKTGSKRLTSSGIFVQRVKPLYYTTEKDVIIYSKIMKFPVNYSPCPCRTSSYRNKVRMLLDRLEKSDPKIKLNIVRSFSTIIPELRKKHGNGVQAFCKKCREPSKGDLCNTCNILGKIAG
ncbi:MAG: TIGR00269 family protein [Nanoarchaeota archaeon]|nr:TIGR00269 family protein [Nanoarchaeota archaeon]